MHTPGPWKWNRNGLHSTKSGRVLVWGNIDNVGLPRVGVSADDCDLIEAAPDLLEACEVTATLPDEAQEIMRREGFVIDNLDDRWQKFAFTLYTMIAASASQAAAAIAKARGDA